MTHLANIFLSLDTLERVPRAACGAVLRPDDSLADAALSSDCDECRARAMVGKLADWKPRPEPSYVAEPDADAEQALRDLMRRRSQ